MDKIHEARYRRKLRMDKIRMLRSIKPHHDCDSIQSTISIPIENFQHQHQPTNNILQDRKVRNRESAFNSRKRKNDEMMYLQQRVHSLEEQVKLLHERLQCYEPNTILNIDSDVMIQKRQQQFSNCNPSQELAMFKI